MDSHKIFMDFFITLFPTGRIFPRGRIFSMGRIFPTGKNLPMNRTSPMGRIFPMGNPQCECFPLIIPDCMKVYSPSWLMHTTAPTIRYNSLKTSRERTTHRDNTGTTMGSQPLWAFVDSGGFQ